MERIKKHIEDAMSNLRAALEGVEAGIEDECLYAACLDDAIRAAHRAKLLIMLYGKYEVDGGAIIVSTPQDVALGGGL